MKRNDSHQNLTYHNNVHFVRSPQESKVMQIQTNPNCIPVHQNTNSPPIHRINSAQMVIPPRLLQG